MANFPTLLQLIIPNLNITTFIGIILAGIGLLSLWISFSGRAFGIKVKTLRKFGLIAILLGLVLIWGVSILQDFITSKGGIIIFWGIILTLIIGFLLFGKRGKK